jgi:hypothetical protein
MIIYPSSFPEVMSLAGVMSPLIIWALSALSTARTKARERRREDWKRIHQLMAMISNQDEKTGAIEQRMAIEELKDFSSYRKQIHSIAVYSRDMFTKSAPNSGLSQRLEQLALLTSRRRLFQLKSPRIAEETPSGI